MFTIFSYFFAPITNFTFTWNVNKYGIFFNVKKNILIFFTF